MSDLFDPNCRRCPLWQTARRVCLPDSGPLTSEYLFIGEAPGADEDDPNNLIGPFVGRAGDIFNEGLAVAGLRREAVRVANVVRCRPPDNRRPKQPEIDACWPYTLRTMAAMPNLRYIIPMGKAAWQAVMVTGTLEDRAGLPTAFVAPDFKETVWPSTECG